MSIDRFINRIICADSLKIMKKMPTESIELILTDPPYLISNVGNKFIDVKGRKVRTGDFGIWDYSFDIEPIVKE